MYKMKKIKDPCPKIPTEAGQYFLVTAHRASNVDIASNLLELLDLLDQLHNKYGNCVSLASALPRNATSAIQ